MNSIEEIALKLGSCDKWLLIGHKIPDGDCIGSLLGLALGLNRLDKKAEIFLGDAVPDNYGYLEGTWLFKTREQLSMDYSGLIYLDCSDTGRVHEDVMSLAGSFNLPTINIDHHASNNLFADYNYVDPGAAATGEIIWHILDILDVPMGKDIAEALYAALLMDTGGFLNGNTTSRVLTVAAELLKWGVDVNQARINLFESKSLTEMMLIKEALQSLGFSPDGRIGWIELPYARLAQINALDVHPEGLVNYARMVRGVEVGVLLREISPGLVKVGLRSRGGLDVAELAQTWGGGGHRQAAGATISGSLDAVKDAVINKIREVM